ncbi:hypothetical protein MNBD_ALPHA04-993, partial [hydrothermal vent metagenome]
MPIALGVRACFSGLLKATGKRDARPAFRVR